MLVKSKHPNINMTNDIYVMVEIQIHKLKLGRKSNLGDLGIARESKI